MKRVCFLAAVNTSRSMPSVWSVFRIIFILALLVFTVMIVWQINATLITKNVRHSGNISIKASKVAISPTHFSRMFPMNRNNAKSGVSEVEIYDYNTKTSKFYKSIFQIDFADWIHKDIPFVVARDMFQSRIVSIKGHYVGLHGYFVCAGNPKTRKDGKPAFHISFWISVNQNDLVQLFGDYGYIQQENEQDPNNLIFRKVPIQSEKTQSI